jgi:uncharacterized protein (DUF1778 family)
MLPHEAEVTAEIAKKYRVQLDAMMALHDAVVSMMTAGSWKLDLRLTRSAKRALQSAATAARRSVSEFVLESALARAEETLPDRQRFGLNAERWAAFRAALDAPARPNPRLKKLLEKPSIFERRRK